MGRLALQASRCLEHLDLRRAMALFLGPFDVDQNVVVAVTHFSETHVGGAKGGTQQAFQWPI